MKSWLVGKDPDAGKDWGQGEKGATEDEMIGWHHWLNRHEFEQTHGDSEGQRSLCAVVHGAANSQTWPSDWTTISINTLNVNESNIPIKKQRLSGCIKRTNKMQSMRFTLKHKTIRFEVKWYRGVWYKC